MAAHTGPSRIQVTWGLGVERGSGYELPFITQKLSPIDNSWRGKLLFSNNISLLIQTHLEKASCPAVDGQHKTNSMILLENFLLVS